MFRESSCLFVIAILASWSTVSNAKEPIRVFILAGQSNMEGKAKVSLLEYQATSAETKSTFAHLRENDSWKSREDVWIKFLDRHGELTVGFGSKNCIGPELEFGWTMGDHYEAPVLIIKTAWGGKSLFRDFRPPSSGLPAEEVLADLLQRQRKRRATTTRNDIEASFGHYYRQMIEEVTTTLADLGKLFPGYGGQGYEIAGLVWFQGWNDMINERYTAEYAENMANLIRDVRRDLDVPQLPVVIGQLGVGGNNEDRPNPAKEAFKAAQASVGKRSEFQGNVAVVETDQYWDLEADAVFKRGWKENLDEWNRVGSDYPYHYLGSAKCYSRIGKGFAVAMLGLQQQQVSFYDPVEQQIEGWTVAIDPQLLSGRHDEVGRGALEALANHLQRVKYIVPHDRLEQLRALRIWVELDNPRLRAMQYHPSRGWLLANRHDPRLVKHVHIPRARALVDPSMWAKHPYVVLHELAHAYHDQVLGFDNPSIIEAYDAAKKRGNYDNVLLFTGKKVQHYGLTNHKEYFAESTEAYFGVNDFYPFVRAELNEHDAGMYRLLERIWGKLQ